MLSEWNRLEAALRALDIEPPARGARDVYWTVEIAEKLEKLAERLKAAEIVCYRAETNGRLLLEAMEEWRRTRGLKDRTDAN